MLKIEKRLICWVEKHMFLLMVLLAVFLSLYLKKICVWWISSDVGCYFDGHANNIQSVLYYGIVQTVQYFPLLPLHSIKWMVGIADYFVALLCVIVVGGYREKYKLRSTFYFVVCLLSPVVFLRGICWAQVDSIAFALLLCAYLMYKKRKTVGGAVLFALGGVTLYPCFVVIVAGYLLCREKKSGWEGLSLLLVAVGSCVLQGFLGMLLGQTFEQGILSCIQWITYDLNGITFRNPLLWMKQMINLLGYGIAMVSGIAAYRKKISYVTVLLVHFVVLLVYEDMLFPEGSILLP